MKFNGMGGMGNMQQLMRQAQKMQEELQQKQQELDETEVIGSVAGGLVEITMLGDKSVKAIKIKPEAVDPDDIEMLEDLIISAFNDASSKIDDLREDLMGNLPAGLRL